MCCKLGKAIITEGQILQNRNVYIQGYVATMWPGAVTLLIQSIEIGSLVSSMNEYSKP